MCLKMLAASQWQLAHRDFLISRERKGNHQMSRLLGMICVCAVAVALIAPAANAAPTSIEMQCNPPAAAGSRMCTARASSFPTYKGWAYLEGRSCLAIGAGCDNAYQGWRWDSNRWVAASVPAGDVYVWPFSKDWSWVWSRSSGWVALRSYSPQIRMSCNFSQTNELRVEYYDSTLCRPS